MLALRWLVVGLWVAGCLMAQVPGRPATFGTIVGPVTQGGVNYLIGGATDLVLDEARGRVYLINTGQRRVEVYSLRQRGFMGTVQTGLAPLGGALSRDGRFLYVTAFEGSALNVIDLETLTLARTISLPAKPEGLAVGADERVLITTIGTGTNNLANTLLIFDPSPGATSNPLQNVLFTPPPPPSPILPPPAGRPAFATRTSLAVTRDGRRIIGFNALSATQRALFVYEVASASIVVSRTVNETSNVLSVSPDGTKFMAGLRLFDTETLQVLGVQTPANLPYAIPANTNLTAQIIQGGSVFAPDGRTVYSSLNVPAVQNQTQTGLSQLLINDADNLLTTMGLKLPEQLAGNMTISSDGGTIYALSESGFLILPVSQINQSPLAMPASTAVLLATDQCGTVVQRTGSVEILNAGRGRFTASAQIIADATAPATASAPAPAARTTTGPGGNPLIEFTYNAANRALGTVQPHSFQIVAPEAINIPPQVRVYQNSRDTEARADLTTLGVNVNPAEGLVDLVLDSARQRLFIANSGMNRVEVFDLARRAFLAPIKVGQLPRSLALTPDGNTLYVANSGGESISIIDAERLALVGRVRFPALPFNSTAAIVTPSVIAATQRGLQIVMSNGTLWKLIGDEAVPRAASPAIGTNTVAAPRTMAATPNGEFLVLLAGNGMVYLFDALADEYVQSRQVGPTAPTGYFGPIAAGPRGQYYLVNGYVLNQALTVIGSAPTVAVPGRPGVTSPRPVGAVSAGGTNVFARLVPPVQTTVNALLSEPASVEMVDATTGIVRGLPLSGLEGLATPVGVGGRVNINGRTMAIDPRGTTAYVLSVSGLSIVPLEPVPAAGRPVVSPNGVVNLGSYQSAIAPNGLVSIFGSSLGRTEAADSTPLPVRLGGVCVTLNNNPLPLFYTSPGQINAQIPPELAVGRYPLVVRSFDNKLSSAAAQVTLTRYAPAVLVDSSGQPAVFHVEHDGTATQAVNIYRPATRDNRLVLYAVGLGPVSGTRLTAGVPTPISPLAETDPVKVFFDDPTIRESEVVVEWSGLVPGYVGLYQINLYVPWNRRRGDSLPITIRVGNVNSPVTGPAAPRIPVN